MSKATPTSVLREVERTTPFCDAIAFVEGSVNKRFGGTCLYQAHILEQQLRSQLGLAMSYHSPSGQTTNGHIVGVTQNPEGSEKLLYDPARLASCPLVVRTDGCISTVKAYPRVPKMTHQLELAETLTDGEYQLKVKKGYPPRVDNVLESEVCMTHDIKAPAAGDFNQQPVDVMSRSSLGLHTLTSENQKLYVFLCTRTGQLTAGQSGGERYNEAATGFNGAVAQLGRSIQRSRPQIIELMKASWEGYKKRHPNYKHGPSLSGLA